MCNLQRKSQKPTSSKTDGCFPRKDQNKRAWYRHRSIVTKKI